MSFFHPMRTMHGLSLYGPLEPVGARVAGIFLSYVRDDAAKARALASLLEKAGHSVWWDRHIKGGSQFAQEIEAALKAAEKVVVLWSAGAVGSPWVRDEAAAGRDTGRLVPVSLDGTQPPLGFGQYQTLDFSNWRGRGRPSAFEGLLEAICVIRHHDPDDCFPRADASAADMGIPDAVARTSSRHDCRPRHVRSNAIRPRRRGNCCRRTGER